MKDTRYLNSKKRFDGVENIKESKNLYKVIKDELTGTTSQPMNESLERTIAKAPSTLQPPCNIFAAHIKA